MSGEATVALADIFVALLVALAVVAVVSRRFAIPYTAALVILGLLVSVVAPLQFEPTPELVLTILVPGLVFEAAFRMDARSCDGTCPGRPCWPSRVCSSWPRSRPACCTWPRACPRARHS